MLSGRRLRVDFVGADLEAGFALVRLAELQLACGTHRDAARALREAEDALVDGRRRLCTLDGAESVQFRPDLDRLGMAIRLARSSRRTPKSGKVIPISVIRPGPRGAP